MPLKQAAQLLGRAGATSVFKPAGPHIDWSPGRSDKIDGAACPEDGRLPDASKGAPHIRDVFNRMGFNDREIVALSGDMQSCTVSSAALNFCAQRQIGGDAFQSPCRLWRSGCTEGIVGQTC